MFNHSKVRWGSRALAIFATVAPLVLSACLENAGVVVKSGASISKSQANCLLPDSAAVAHVASRLAASAVDVSNADFCAKPEGYECYVRRFSPGLVDGESTIEETAHVADLGGNVVFRLAARNYSTRDAARAPGVSAAALQPGGDFNRSEYVCNQHDLKDGTSYLAVGEGDNLNDALAAAYAKCTGVAPRLAAAKGK
ncbi:MAG: hypothetical protein JST04_11515 [Bdellovibrionales bacterium]|nr:hypothetical protein [Bdellovibrionales bacterium]